MGKTFSVSAILLSIGLLSACAGSLKRTHLDSTTADLPKVFSLANDSASKTPSQHAWWLQCNDPALNHHIEAALQHAPNMQAAWARLEQAAASARVTKSALMPTLNASADLQTTDRKGPPSISSLITDTYNIQLIASYELDLWGRNSSRSKAVQSDAIASREDAETLAISLSAEVATTWWSLLAQHQILINIQAQEKIQLNIYELQQQQQRSGMRTAAEVAMQKQSLTILRTQHAQATAAKEVLRLRLNLLCGLAPQTTVVIEKKLPQLSTAPSLGIPLTLLAQRPDVRAALNRVYAADQRTAAAKGDRLPQFSISVSAGFQNNTTIALFENWFTRLSANILAPIFDGGRLKAEQRRSEAILRERLALYRSSVLTAITEVEEALHQERAAIQAHAQARLHYELATQQVEDMHLRYRNASIQLNALHQEQLACLRSQRSMIDSERDQLLQRIALHRALGGRWTTVLTDNTSHTTITPTAETPK